MCNLIGPTRLIRPKFFDHKQHEQSRPEQRRLCPIRRQRIALARHRCLIGPDHAGSHIEIAAIGAKHVDNVNRWYQVLIRQFTDVLILILVIAAAVSLAVGEVADAVTVLAIVLLNGVLGFVQEWKAEWSIEALQHMLMPHCKVIRDGDELDIDATELVPGDVVQLETGDFVPADLRIVHARNLKIDESALTGESDSIEKQTQCVDKDTPLSEQSCMAWMGTAVTTGRALCAVTATGSKTQFGKIAKLTETIGRETTLLQRQLSRLGKQLGAAAIVISVAVALAGWMSGQPIFDMFLTGVSLAVAVVPEGLPAVVTLTLALGIHEMVRRKAMLPKERQT